MLNVISIIQCIDQVFTNLIFIPMIFVLYVKFRPKSKGKDIIAVGDQNIELSTDFGKTWTTISEEKGLFVGEWMDENTLVLAGKNRVVKMTLR